MSEITIASEDLPDLLDEATCWAPALDATDAHGEVDEIIDRIVDTLRGDPRFPRLTRFEYELLFADARNAAEASLTKLIENRADTTQILDAVSDEIMKLAREKKVAP